MSNIIHEKYSKDTENKDNDDNFVASKMPLLTKAEKKEFLRSAPFKSKSKQATSSMNLYNFASYVEQIITNKTNIGEDQVDNFISDLVEQCW
jgi:hypothetical protein